jgi:hypothetical protein
MISCTNSNVSPIPNTTENPTVNKTNEPDTLNQPQVFKLDYYQPSIIKETKLELFIRPLDALGELLKVEGYVDVALMRYEDFPVNAPGETIQNWMNVPIVSDQFEPELGTWVEFNYLSFTPVPDQKGYILLSLKVGDQIITYEGIILLLRGSCCA